MGEPEGSWFERKLLRGYGALPSGLRQRSVRALKPSFTVGVMPVVTAPNGHVLLVRHSYMSGWSLPGGLVNKRERMAVAIIRETREEVGIDIELVGEPTVTLDPYAQVVRIVHRAALARGLTIDAAHPASAEIAEVGWFSSSNLPDLLPESAEALTALERVERATDGPW